jgi:hypothetical protein
VTALVPVTEELLEDAAALGGYVAGKAGEKIDVQGQRRDRQRHRRRASRSAS